MIINIDKLIHVETHLIPGSLLALDLDDTIMQSATYFGSEEWQWDLFARYQEEGLSPEEAFLKANKKWESAQYLIDVRQVEADTKTIIDEWKNKFTVIGLTARTPTIAEITNKQLKKVNIDLSSSLHPSGILFSGGKEKGKILMDFLENKKVGFEKILAVDDKKPNLESILRHCSLKGIQFTGFHYLGKKPYTILNPSQDPLKKN